jgi:FkbM family methyltransferase
MVKELLLKWYNFLLPQESYVRYRIYSRLLWKIFPDKMDRILLEFARAQTAAVKVIQIGACDGLSFDPLRKYFHEFAWQGILIEPNPIYFKELIRNYSGIKPGNLVFENIGISDKNEELTIHYPAKSGPGFRYRNFYKLLGTFDEHLYRQLKSEYSRIDFHSQTVRCESINELMERYDYFDCDILYSNVEGFDGRIILSTDFSRSRPKIVIFESKFLTEQEKANIYKFLPAHGYSIEECNDRIIACRI